MTDDPRADYLDYDQITALLGGWEKAHPAFVRRSSLGETPEGREIWMLTLGRDPDRVRPAMLVDGNMHASELAGSSAVLAFAEDLIAVHRGEVVHGLAPALLDIVREGLVYLVPRQSPDGAEAVMKTGAYVRSAPRNDRTATQHAHWITEDLDGDGEALVMRVEDPTGEFVAIASTPGLLVLREVGDTGPFYKVYPEGRIENWDGKTVPTPSFLGDNRVDFNRNYPFLWAPECDQVGAGPYPLSEPETRAMADFVIAHPEVFAWVNFHTFGGVFIRPLGDAPDSKMVPSDLALYRQVEQWATDLTGYPTVAGHEFVYEPEKPLHGDQTAFAYRQRGALSWVCELWDLFEQVGLPKTPKFVDRYTWIDRAGMIAIAKWDAEHNEGRLLRPWRVFEHPQLGRVELGGLDPRIGLWNPPPDRLPEICDAQSNLMLRTAALAPSLHLEVETRQEGEWLHLRVVVENRGYLSTQFVAAAAKLGHNEPVSVVLESDGEVLGAPRETVGHLEGWGRGRFDGSAALYFLRSSGSVSRATVDFTVKGGTMWTVRAGSSRVGHVVQGG